MAEFSYIPDVAPEPEPGKRPFYSRVGDFFYWLKKRHRGRWHAIFAVLLLLALSVQLFVFQAPRHFVAKTSLTVEKGETLSQIASSLKERSIIRSAFVFKFFVYAFGKTKSIEAGSYLFTSPESIWHVAWTLGDGKHGLPIIRLTVPEGTAVKDIPKLVSKDFYNFNSREFLRLAKNSEGSLFPDTYFFSADAGALDILNRMNETFKEKITSLEGDFSTSTRKKSDIIIMASILEGEANDDTSRRMVSGILWKRIDLGIALQADATLKYVTGRGSADLTPEDLDSKSPYNSYKYTGLPPTPISNPGFEALEAALHPTKSNYLYFISDSKGVMHYAETLDQHNDNVAKYIR